MADWVTAKELLNAFAASGAGGSTFAVCRRAHAGLLDARAGSLVVSDGEPNRDAPIPREFWWAEGHEALEQDWERGDFSTWMDVRGRKMEIKAFGVMFHKRDAEAMGAEFPPEPMLSMEVFDVIDRRAAEHWHRETWWHWIDAVVWAANQNPDEMKILAGYRSVHMRSPDRPLLNEVARTYVGSSMLRPSVRRATEAELLAALRAGDVTAKGAETAGGDLRNIDPSEWSRLLAPVVDTVTLVLEPKTIKFHDVRLRGADLLSLWPIPGPAVGDGASGEDAREPIEKSDWEVECKRVAAALDAEGVAIRDVRAHHVAARWKPHLGAPAKKEAVIGWMIGKPKGAPGKRHDN